MVRYIQFRRLNNLAIKRLLETPSLTTDESASVVYLYIKQKALETEVSRGKSAS